MEKGKINGLLRRGAGAPRHEGTRLPVTVRLIFEFVRSFGRGNFLKGSGFHFLVDFWYRGDEIDKTASSTFQTNHSSEWNAPILKTLKDIKTSHSRDTVPTPLLHPCDPTFSTHRTSCGSS